MSASTSPERTSPAPLRVAVVDDRGLLASGLRSSLAKFRNVEIVDVDALGPGDFALVGLCAHPYEPPVGIRVLELKVERSVVDLVRTLHSDPPAARRRRQGRALSERERTILSMTADGSSAHQIADELGVSARTVERHRRAVTDKLAARSSAHAVAVGALGDDTRQTG